MAVSIDDIIARNSILILKSHMGEVISHDPQELLTDYKQQNDIQAHVINLKGILSAALASEGDVQGRIMSRYRCTGATK